MPRSYLVLATSTLGLLTAARLSRRGFVGPAASWLLHCLYAAKAAMLLLPEAYLVVPTAMLALAASAPYFLYGQPQRGAQSGVGPAAAPSRRRAVRIAPGVGALHALSVVMAVALARFAVFDVVQLLVSARPGEGLLLGALVLTLAGGLVPLASTCYTNNSVRRKAGVERQGRWRACDGCVGETGRVKG